MPKMGESISEATIISWLKNVGDTVDAEEIILEVATDKVDSEVPSPVSGVITEIRFAKNDVVKVGEVLAFIETDGKTAGKKITIGKTEEASEKKEPRAKTENPQPTTDNRQPKSNPDAFLSPLTISIAQKENLSIEEVQSIRLITYNCHPERSRGNPTNNQQPTTS